MTDYQQSQKISPSNKLKSLELGTDSGPSCTTGGKPSVEKLSKDLNGKGGSADSQYHTGQYQSLHNMKKVNNMKKMILIALATAGCQIAIAQQQVRIDTLHAYPAYKPYYFEMIVQTELDLVYMVNVCNEHGLQRRKWIQVKDPAGMALDARETEGFARFYFPELIGNYELIESK